MRGQRKGVCSETETGNRKEQKFPNGHTKQ